ncbi:MAG: NAD(P)-binding domain-containing protein [Verrucomicrobia bacterium]|jgi:2-polyprenyl-6-methoxyphenol hydroxylase-like FAD-dependent oxidoreductase|nr:NAD(P)-binding domain-containing protein [Verrucomicrobiota bacterium]
MEAKTVDGVIVGAGPAGLGCALALQKAGIGNFLILERSVVGASFKAWPREMRWKIAFRMLGRQVAFAAGFALCIAWSGALLGF